MGRRRPGRALDTPTRGRRHPGRDPLRGPWNERTARRTDKDSAGAGCRDGRHRTAAFPVSGHLHAETFAPGARGRSDRRIQRPLHPVTSWKVMSRKQDLPGTHPGNEQNCAMSPGRKGDDHRTIARRFLQTRLTKSSTSGRQSVDRLDRRHPPEEAFFGRLLPAADCFLRQTASFRRSVDVGCAAQGGRSSGQICMAGRASSSNGLRGTSRSRPMGGLRLQETRRLQRGIPPCKRHYLRGGATTNSRCRSCDRIWAVPDVTRRVDTHLASRS